MNWVAHLSTGSSVSSNIMSLRQALEECKGRITAFYWFDDSGMKLGCSVPLNCEVVAFKRNYIDTDGIKTVIFVLGWKFLPAAYSGVETLAFLQPDGLVEVSGDREYKTTFERGLTKGS